MKTLMAALSVVTSLFSLSAFAVDDNTLLLHLLPDGDGTILLVRILPWNTTIEKKAFYGIFDKGEERVKSDLTWVRDLQKVPFDVCYLQVNSDHSNVRKKWIREGWYKIKAITPRQGGFLLGFNSSKTFKGIGCNLSSQNVTVGELRQALGPRVEIDFPGPAVEEIEASEDEPNTKSKSASGNPCSSKSSDGASRH